MATSTNIIVATNHLAIIMSLDDGSGFSLVWVERADKDLSDACQAYGPFKTIEEAMAEAAQM